MNEGGNAGDARTPLSAHVRGCRRLSPTSLSFSLLLLTTWLDLTMSSVTLDDTDSRVQYSTGWATYIMDQGGARHSPISRLSEADLSCPSHQCDGLVRRRFPLLRGRQPFLHCTRL